jgi:ABC-type hemin transport system ATPase subunit
MYADKIIVLKNGEITESGPPIKIFSPKMILENFDLNVSIIKHPTRECPQLIAL